MSHTCVAMFAAAVLLSGAVAAAQTPATGTSTPTTGGASAGTAANAAPKLALSGDVALWTIEIRADRAKDFERIVAKLQEALSTSDKPERKQQAAGWKVMKVDKPLPNGNVAYVHIISPVVAGADYAIMQSLYDELPEERQALYEMYKGAFSQNLSLATGTMIADMSKSAPAAAAP
jgi:hypothetical protein